MSDQIKPGLNHPDFCRLVDESNAFDCCQDLLDQLVCFLVVGKVKYRDDSLDHSLYSYPLIFQRAQQGKLKKQILYNIDPSLLTNVVVQVVQSLQSKYY